MSKKTRKKSSKALPGKSGRTSAAKPSAAKAARGSKASVKKPAAKKPAAKAGKAAAKGTAKGAGKKPAQNHPGAQSRFGQSVSQGTIEIVKIQSIGAAQVHKPTLKASSSAGSRDGIG